MNKRIFMILSLCFVLSIQLWAAEDPDPTRFQKTIDHFEYWDSKNAIPDDFVLMIGSSSIVMWKSMESFPDLKIVNRGFGGSHISDVLHYKNEVLLKYKAPQSIVFYCGDNDVAGGKSAEQVYEDFIELWEIVKEHSCTTPLIYVPIKPCPSRWHLWDEANRFNEMILKLSQEDPWLYYADTPAPMLETGTPPDSSLFIKDLLHLSRKGYAMWTTIVRPILDKAINQHVEKNLVLYEELTPTAFRNRIKSAPIAYLPLGTLEWHGEHLPLGADGLQSKHFFEILAKEAGGIVLPMLYLGPDRKKKIDGKELYGMDLGSMHWIEDQKYPDQQLDGSAYWISDKDYQNILENTWKQLSRAGFRIVVAHGHGPSTKLAQDHFEKWEKEYGMKFFNCWSDRDAEGLGIMVDHAAMNETSLTMALRPELVHMEYLDSDISKWPIGLGGKDPRIHASTKLGKKAIKIQKERMVKLLQKALNRLE